MDKLKLISDLYNLEFFYELDEHSNVAYFLRKLLAEYTGNIIWNKFFIIEINPIGNAYQFSTRIEYITIMSGFELFYNIGKTYIDEKYDLNDERVKDFLNEYALSQYNTINYRGILPILNTKQTRNILNLPDDFIEDLNNIENVRENHRFYLHYKTDEISEYGFNNKSIKAKFIADQSEYSLLDQTNLTRKIIDTLGPKSSYKRDISSMFYD